MIVQIATVRDLEATNNLKIKNGVKQKVSFRFCMEYYLTKRILFLLLLHEYFKNKKKLFKKKAQKSYITKSFVLLNILIYYLPQTSHLPGKS